MALAPVGPELAAALDDARAEATKRGHALVGLEHLLVAIVTKTPLRWTATRVERDA